jgi:hypothetical protein
LVQEVRQLHQPLACRIVARLHVLNACAEWVKLLGEWVKLLGELVKLLGDDSCEEGSAAGQVLLHDYL